MKLHKDIFTELGDTIRQKRKFLKLTQQELADFCECGLTFINQLESGKSSIRFDKLISVLKFLEIEFVVKRGKLGLNFDEL